MEGVGGGGAPGKGRGRRARGPPGGSGLRVGAGGTAVSGLGGTGGGERAGAARGGWRGRALGGCSPITPAEGSRAAGVLGCQEPRDRNAAGAGG